MITLQDNVITPKPTTYTETLHKRIWQHSKDSINEGNFQRIWFQYNIITQNGLPSFHSNFSLTVPWFPGNHISARPPPGSPVLRGPNWSWRLPTVLLTNLVHPLQVTRNPPMDNATCDQVIEIIPRHLEIKSKYLWNIYRRVLLVMRNLKFEIHNISPQIIVRSSRCVYLHQTTCVIWTWMALRTKTTSLWLEPYKHANEAEITLVDIPLTMTNNYTGVLLQHLKCPVTCWDDHTNFSPRPWCHPYILLNPFTISSLLDNATILSKIFSKLSVNSQNMKVLNESVA